jgi:hypothetical protein
MPSDGRFNETGQPGSLGHTGTYDVTGNNGNVLRVHGGTAGRTVTNRGPVAVENAVAVAPDSAYGTVTTIAVGSSQAVAAGADRDFWPLGAGRARLEVS